MKTSKKRKQKRPLQHFSTRSHRPLTYVLTALLLVCGASLYGQKNYNLSSLIYDAGKGYSDLLYSEQVRYNLLTDTAFATAAYIVKMRDPETVQDYGAMVVDLPWDSRAAFLIAREVEPLDNGYSWYGQVWFDSLGMDTLDHHVIGYFYLVKTDTFYTATINLDDKTYSLRHLGRDLYIVTEFNTAADKGCVTIDSLAGDVSVYYEEEQDTVVSRNTRSCQVRVLALYTDAARDVMGGDAAARREIELSIRSANTALRNSAISPNEIKLVLVGTEHYDEFVETNGIDMNNEFKLNFEPILDNPNSDLQTLRNSVFADIVVVFTNGKWTNASGASLLFAPTEKAAALVNIQGANATLRTAHEIGHLFGCLHDILDQPQGEFEHGHEFRAGGGFLGLFQRIRRTVMAVPAGDKRILHYSNPRIRFMGKKTGVEDLADNARMINNTGCHVAGHRTGESQPISMYFNAPRVSCFCGYVTVSAVASCPEPVTFTYHWSYSYDGFTYTTPALGISSFLASMPCEGLSLNPAEGIFVRVTVTASNSETITRTTHIEGSYTTDDKGLPCALHRPTGELRITDARDLVRLQPNPIADELEIVFTGEQSSGQLAMAIYDSKGNYLQMVRPNQATDQADRLRVDMRHLPPGSYFLSWADRENRIYTRSFIKI